MDITTGEKPLEARFQLTTADSRAFAAIAQGRTDTSKSGNLKRNLIMLLTVAVISGLMFKFLPNTAAPRPVNAANAPMTWQSVASLLAPMLLFLGFWGFLFYAQKKARAAAPAWNEPSVVSLDKNGVTQRAGAVTNNIEWRGIHRVLASSDHVGLFTSKDDGLVVPRRAFDADEDWHNYVNFAREHWQKAQPIVPPIANA